MWIWVIPPVDTLPASPGDPHMHADTLAGATPEWSGAQLGALVRSAAVIALRHDIRCQAVNRPAFEEALRNAPASTSASTQD